MSEAVSNGLAASCGEDNTIHFCSTSFGREKAVAASVALFRKPFQHCWCSYCEGFITLAISQDFYNTEKKDTTQGLLSAIGLSVNELIL